MQNIEEKIVLAAKEIAAHKGIEISNVRNRVALSFYIFDKNFEELYRCLEIFEQKDFLLKLNASSDFQIANPQIDEVARTFHNYLASAFALVDHTRNMIKKLYSQEQFFSEYEDKLTTTLTNNNLRNFIQDLRVYMTHYYVPILNLRCAGRPSTREVVSCDVVLLTKDLLTWNNWKSSSKKYLDDKEYILLKSVTQEYFEIIGDFYAWLEKRQHLLHETDMNDIVKLIQKYKDLVKDITYDHPIQT